MNEDLKIHGNSVEKFFDFFLSGKLFQVHFQNLKSFYEANCSILRLQNLHNAPQLNKKLFSNFCEERNMFSCEILFDEFFLM